jgi:hypothetical protein
MLGRASNAAIDRATFFMEVVPLGHRFCQAIVRDHLDLDRAVARMDRGSALGVVRHLERSTPGDRATLGEGTPGQVTRTDRSNALATVRSLAASHSRARRSAKPVSTRVARHPLSEALAAQHHRAEPQRAGAELLRYCTAEKPLAPGR